MFRRIAFLILFAMLSVNQTAASSLQFSKSRCPRSSLKQLVGKLLRGLKSLRKKRRCGKKRGCESHNKKQRLQSRSHIQQGQGDVARRNGIKQTKRAKKVTLYLAEGNQLLKLQDYQNAVQQFDLAIRLDPNNGRAFYQFGVCQLKLGNFMTGVVSIAQAIEFDADLNDNFYRKLSTARWFSDKIIPELDKHVAIHPHAAHLYFLRGVFHYLKSDRFSLDDSEKRIEAGKALADLDQCLRLNSGYTAARIYRADVLTQTGFAARALVELKIAITAEPRSGLARYFQAKAYASQLDNSPKASKSAIQKCAVESLVQAHKNKFDIYSRIRRERCFDKLREYPAFRKLVLEGP